jgi:hypothetical protein
MLKPAAKKIRLSAYHPNKTSLDDATSRQWRPSRLRQGGALDALTWLL